MREDLWGPWVTVEGWLLSLSLVGQTCELGMWWDRDGDSDVPDQVALIHESRLDDLRDLMGCELRTLMGCEVRVTGPMLRRREILAMRIEGA